MSERRQAVPFDPDHFGRRAAAGEALDRVETFRRIWRSNHWAGEDSVSGAGSGDDQTAVLRVALPALFARLGVRTLLDVPCGDWRWMAQVPLGDLDYIGGDLVAELVAGNRQRFGGPRRTFVELDLATSALPEADLLLCRDCLVHLSLADITRVLANLSRSRITWLLTTTFPAESDHRDIVTGDWRPLNLEAAPFAFPPPAELINEGCTEGGGRFADKSLGLWRVADLPLPYV